jgi:hypothetical protein
MNWGPEKSGPFFVSETGGRHLRDQAEEALPQVINIPAEQRQLKRRTSSDDLQGNVRSDKRVAL